jgi:hypothetical protein
MSKGWLNILWCGQALMPITKGQKNRTLGVPTTNEYEYTLFLKWTSYLLNAPKVCFIYYLLFIILFSQIFNVAEVVIINKTILARLGN